MTLVTKSLRLPEELITDIETLYGIKEKYKSFNFSDYMRDAIVEKYERDKQPEPDTKEKK